MPKRKHLLLAALTNQILPSFLLNKPGIIPELAFDLLYTALEHNTADDLEDLCNALQIDISRLINLNKRGA